MASRSLPSWVWLLLAAALLVFAVVWWSQGDAGEGSHAPSVLDNGRRPAQPGGDFSSVRRDRQIESRERSQPSILTPPGQGSAAPRGAAGAAPASP